MMQIQPIAFFRAPFKSKFGIPRQSGIVEGVRGSIVLTREWSRMEAVEGLLDFDYLWLIWGFSENVGARKHATVRPPRLGGNRRKGVFATRSSFRPNNLALSSVRVTGVEESPDGVLIHVTGADLMDGTPIYDIKPYITFTDSHPEARSGFVDEVGWKPLEVVVPEPWSEPFSPEELAVLRQVLAQDPRPSYQEDATRVYGMPYGCHDVRFRVEGDILTVVEVKEQSARIG